MRAIGGGALDLPETIAALGELLEKYRLLEALRLAEPGRTDARRDAMRVIAERFPGALREWDEASLDQIVQRREAVEEALSTLGRSPAEGLAHFAAPQQSWMRHGIAVHVRLREALRVKRWLAGRAITDALVAEAGERFHLDREGLEAIAAPPVGRVSEAIHREVALLEGIGIEALKASLFPGELHGEPGAGDEPRRGRSSAGGG